MATNKKDGTSQPSRSRKAPEKSASKSVSRTATKKQAGASKRAQPKAMAGSRSATKSQAVPAKSRSSAGSRTAARSTSGASGSRSTTPARSASRSQGSLLNPMAWLSTLETTLTSPQARTVMAEALRAVANVLEKPQGRAGAGQRNAGGQGRRVGRRKPWRRDRCCSAGGRSGCHRSRRGGRDERPWRLVGRGPRQRQEGWPAVLAQKKSSRQATSQPNDRPDGKQILQDEPGRPASRSIDVLEGQRSLGSDRCT